MRHFSSPSGRQWSAQLTALPAAGTVASDAHGAPATPGRALLRFQSESLVLELRDWPADWESLPDDALVALVRRAQPPGLGLTGDVRDAR